MDTKLPKYLYRSIKLEYLDLYMNNPSEIPFLEGKFFKQFKHLNPFPYEDDVRYMHFFDEREMAKGYAKNSSEEGKFMAPHIVCVFKFPDEILEACRTDGLFGISTTTGRTLLEKHNEYIIPAQAYNPAEHFVGVLDKSSMTPNVYAVINKKEIEKYATDLSAVSGREYAGEYLHVDSYVQSCLSEREIIHESENLKRVLSGFESNTRAIEMFSKEAAADASLKRHFSYNPDIGWDMQKVIDVLSGVNIVFSKQNKIVPFYVDPAVLEQFKMGESIHGGFEYLVPIDYLTEANYFETGNDWLDDFEMSNIKIKE